MRRNRPFRPATAAASAATVLAVAGSLSGCGVSGTEFHPGVAAQVGTETVTTDHVDEVTANYCVAVEDQIAEGGNKLPMRILKSGVAGQLAMVSAVEQLAEEYGVEPTSQYRSELSALKSQTGDLEDDVAASFIEVNSAGSYIADVLTSIGGIELERAGQAEPTLEQRQTAGLEALAGWSEREDVEFDPRYGLEFRDGQPVSVDTDVSYPVGELAKAGLLPEPDAEYAASLPDELVCG